MPIVTKESMLLALKNIASFGDTDIFPFPNENHLFYDRPLDVVPVLEEIDRDFNASISRMPVLTAKELAVVGYGGFRQGTQVDPIWNAYLLSLVIEAGIDIEKRRVTPDVVLSYRYKPEVSMGALFDKNVGWPQFQESITKDATNFPFILRCDISDFYPRIYHHRMENALAGAVQKPEITKSVFTISLSVWII